MGASFSHLVCLAVGYLYPSYSCYKALNSNASNLDLVHRLASWALVTAFLFLTHRVFDPLFIVIIPMYPLAKVLFVLWMVSQHSKGGSLLFVKHVEPLLDRFEASLEDVVKALGVPVLDEEER